MASNTKLGMLRNDICELRIIGLVNLIVGIEVVASVLCVIVQLPSNCLVEISCSGKPIKAKSSMKILGFTLNSRCSMDSHLSMMKSRVGMELSKIKPYLPHMNL